MLVTLLLLAPAIAEWVEISQQHYRKPVFSHHSSDIDFQHHFEGTTRKSNRINTLQVTDVDTTEVEIPNDYKKPPRTTLNPNIEEPEDLLEVNIDESPPRRRKPIRTQYLPTHTVTEDYFEPTRDHIKEPTTSTIEEIPRLNSIFPNQSLSGSNNIYKGTISKVPKLGQVQRVKLVDNQIKAPNIRNNLVKSSITLPTKSDLQLSISETKHHSEILFPTSTKEGLDEYLRKVKGHHSNNNLQKQFNNVSLSSENIVKLSTTSTSRPKNNVSLRTPFYKHGSNDYFEKETYKDKPKTNINYHDRVSNVEFNTNINVSTTEEVLKNDPFNYNPIKFHKLSKDKISDTADSHTEFITAQDENLNEDLYATVSEDSDDSSAFTEKSSEKEELNQSDVPSNDSKVNVMENLKKIIKVVADTIRQNTRSGVNSKTRYLTQLKDTILANIEERIESTWPDEAHTRQARSVHASSRGHIEIPSSESALMTISFLTFAVFLIKLVLQVIQTYKNKAMMVTPAVVATVGRAAIAKKNQWSDATGT